MGTYRYYNYPWLSIVAVSSAIIISLIEALQ